MVWSKHLFLLFPLLLPGQAIANCDAPPSKIDKAYAQCDALRATKVPQDMAAALRDLQKEGFCAVSDQGARTAISKQEICKAPGEFVCSNSTGRFFNSECQLELVEARDIPELASYKNAECAFDQEKKEFLETHRMECSFLLSNAECDNYLKILYAKDILKLERSHFYTPKRVARLQADFARVKQKFLDLIAHSSVVPEDKKAYLLSKLQDTQLLADPEKNASPECMNSGLAPPGTELYNNANGSIVVCLGVMANLERINPQELILSLAHELAHSIDPCMLERLSFEAKHPAPKLGMETYPGLLQCLRGGKGEDGCTGSILHCNSAKGIADAVAQMKAEDIQESPNLYASPDSQEKLEIELKAAYKASPDCPLGKHDEELTSMSAADFRQDPEPIQQIGETFADFSGAEVAGLLAAEEAAKGKFSAKDGLDALVAISSTFAQLHGTCLSTNTHDEHPPGAMRVDRDVMSSRIFRESVGCMDGPPMTAAAKTSCTL